jgi:hypothetical protein
MILESAQILCTALYKKGYETPYKPTHPSHPCVLWAEHSYANFKWLSSLTFELNREYRYRYDKATDHKSMNAIKEISGIKFKDFGLTEFAQAMPDEYRIPGNPVRAYRQYYLGEKLRFAKWTRRKKPFWIKANLNRDSL